MNRSALILHLLLKDLRFQRAWLILLWLLALVLPLTSGYISPGLYGTNALMTGATGGFELIYLVILLRIIQLDPPGRGTHFLATRPVTGLLYSAVKFCLPVLFSSFRSGSRGSAPCMRSAYSLTLSTKRCF